MDGYRAIVDLPDNPTELAALLTQIAAHATRLAQDVNRDVHNHRPESVKKAVDIAVSVLYFHGAGKYDKGHAALIAIVNELAPEIGSVLVVDGYSAAYRILHPEEET